MTVVQKMAIRDLSVSGARIQTSAALRLDSLHTFRLILDDRAVVATGRVAHCRVASLTRGAVVYDCGIEFVDLAAAGRNAILGYLRRRTASPDRTIH
jgi:hypothetical protein